MKLETIYHILRSFALFWIFKKVRLLLAGKPFILPLLGSVAVYKFISFLIDKFIEKIYNARRLNSQDELFLMEGDNYNSNLGLLLYFENSDFDKMKTFMRDKFFQSVHGMRAKLINVLGRNFWRSLDKKEFDESFDRVFQLADDV